MAISRAHTSLSCNVNDIEKKNPGYDPLSWSELKFVSLINMIIKINSYMGHLKKVVYHNVSSSY